MVSVHSEKPICASSRLSEVSPNVALPASVSARSFPFTPAYPVQYTHRSFRSWISTIHTFQSGRPIPFSTFCGKLVESVRMMACVVRLSPLETIQRRAWVTASTSIVKLEVETVEAALSSWMVLAPCSTVKPRPDWSLVTEPSVYTMRSCGLPFS